MNFDQVVAELTEEQATVIKKALSDAKAEIPKETSEALTASETAKKAAEAKLAKSEADLKVAKEKSVKEETLSEEEVLKSLDPAVLSIITKAKNQAAAAEALAKSLQDSAFDSEAIAKAKDLPHLAKSELDIAGVYKKLKVASAPLAEEVFAILKAADAAVEAGKVTKELGAGGGEPDITENAAWNAIEVKAESIRKGRDMTKEKAIQVAIEEAPELYNAYLNAQM